jgi:protein-tyrosine phosphatase
MTDRAIRWEGFYNARDLGGLPLAGGGSTRYGAMIRCADPCLVTAAGWRSAVDAGFRTVLDLRNDDEAEPGAHPAVTLVAGTFSATSPAPVAPRPAEIRSLRVPLDDIEDVGFWRPLNEQGLNGTPLYYRPFVEAKAGRIAAALTAMACAGPGGIIFHCGGGRDRAGLISLLVLALAGVTPAAIAADYELSLGQIDPLIAAMGHPQRESDMRAFLMRRGTTVRASILDLLGGLDVSRLLGEAGMADAHIAALRSRLTG